MKDMLKNKFTLDEEKASLIGVSNKMGKKWFLRARKPVSTNWNAKTRLKLRFHWSEK